MLAGSRHTTRNILIVGFLIVGLVIFAIKTGQAPKSELKGERLSGLTAEVYRSANCGCCGQYIAYLKQKGITVEEKIVGNEDADLGAVKQQFAVPPQLQSCHTMRIGDYTVEGHVPISAIVKLLAEKPPVAGIALPGMPIGSPGMPGAKSGSFEVRSFTASNDSGLFMSI